MEVTKGEQHFTTSCLKFPMSHVYYCHSRFNESEWIIFPYAAYSIKKTNKFQAKTKFCCYFCFHKQYPCHFLLTVMFHRIYHQQLRAKWKQQQEQQKVYRTSYTNYKLNWQDSA